VLSGIVGSLGLSPFWSDVIVSLIIAYTTGHWAGHIWTEAARKEKIMGLEINEEKRPSFLAILKRMSSSAILLPVLVALLVWNVTPLVKIIKNRNWMLCGTIITSCRAPSCLKLYDSRRRMISDDCYQFKDELGYIEISASNFLTYQPEFISMQCNGTTSEITKIKDSMFQVINPSCDGLMKMP
jgi:hypothetical protein